MKRQLMTFLLVYSIFATDAFAGDIVINPETPTADCFDETIGNKTSGTVKYKAYWQPITYKIKFDPNYADGGTPMPDQICVYDTEYQLSENTYTRTDYKFTGWCTTAACTGTSAVRYNNNATVSKLTTSSTEPFILYAQWEPYCASNKWLHIGDGENDKICLYENRHDTSKPSLAVQLDDKTYYIDMSPANLKIHKDSTKMLKVLYNDEQWTAHDLTSVE